MEIEVLANPDSVAGRAAAFIAGEARAAVVARKRFVIALSGGHTPWIMLRALAGQDIPWSDVCVFQVDERFAPLGHVDRNLTHLRENLLEQSLLSPAQVYAMPIEDAEPESTADLYAAKLRAIAGSPPVLDLVHLGLGTDGHTASLVPGDPVLDVTEAAVALTGEYQGRRRMTLTYPVLNHARRILWVVTGSDKAAMLPRLRNGDATIAAGRVRQDNALLLADVAATGRRMQGK